MLTKVSFISQPSLTVLWLPRRDTPFRFIYIPLNHASALSVLGKESNRPFLAPSAESLPSCSYSLCSRWNLGSNNRHQIAWSYVYKELNEGRFYRLATLCNQHRLIKYSKTVGSPIKLKTGNTIVGLLWISLAVVSPTYRKGWFLKQFTLTLLVKYCSSSSKLAGTRSCHSHGMCTFFSLCDGTETTGKNLK